VGDPVHEQREQRGAGGGDEDGESEALHRQLQG
jgi:hypothetical protein